MTAVGYVRVSTPDQNPALQNDALTAAGCAKIFTDVASGARADRPQLIAALDYLRPGDVFIVWQLDRLGRSMRHLIDTVKALHERGVQFRSLRESIDTTTAAGRLTFHLFAALAEFERDLLRERTTAGLAAIAARRARGRRGGRPRKMTAEKIAVARQMYASQQYTVDQIAHTLGVSRGTIYQHLDRTAA
ncbi:invertase [Virgisporangium aliadipatigenens]|uniref:Invertase n=1 Tax=Virgisporangium aliadipatigenens TaxID=741659 RepID=A0A8J3YTX3_9ACTN|nr:recombinase family protein [Virgisporangium aliadipatigenens]GIJ49746.1 invertase [Virgisporangium aliadipatigenens]